MKFAKTLFMLFLFFTVTDVKAQETQTQNNVQNAVQTVNSLDNISLEVAKISKSMATFNKRLKEFLDQFALSKGNQINERQQKLLLGFEILNRAEQRLEVLQKFQIELAEKEVSVKSRIIQVEQEMRPDSVERSIAFVGTTKSEEIRDGKRRALESEKSSLQTLYSQIQRNLAQTTGELRQAEILVQNLRKKILPQIELEISDL